MSVFGWLTLPFPGSGAECGGGSVSSCWDEGLGLPRKHLLGFHFLTWWHCQSHLRGFLGHRSLKCSEACPGGEADQLPSGLAGTFLQIFEIPRPCGFQSNNTIIRGI